MWHEGLIFKLESNGICGSLLNFFKYYLCNRHQRVVLNGTVSKWVQLTAGVPQGSLVGPLLFLVHVNELREDICCNMRLYADDSSLFTQVDDIQSTRTKIERELGTIFSWAYQWMMIFNPDITKQAVEIIFALRTNKFDHPEIICNVVPVEKKNY